ncbi:esterase-like activity of phytase family protein [Luteimicrobium subarcticum]|uniref:glycerophosphodiester phosphodiesterase n=1 Tax=Luteimicrobium subarcticum TaxID=620910 RepID=A0A2M8WUH4_9MICO|nr:esterase-like activity of phytase family protein [Luteimicrobium subarcticum]PJI94558.1 glycerophosphoryl diester phosphodiesterase [Luteimicrobium subarcticum]
MRRRQIAPVVATALAATLLAPLTTLTAAASGADHGAAAHGAPLHDASSHQTTRTVDRATLVARATLSADYLAPGPASGALATPANGRTGPFAGQVIPGFSAVLDAGDGTFWAQPDNGFGSKANSADYLLRLYHVDPHWQTSRHGALTGSGEIEVEGYISLRDPDHRFPFPIVHEDTRDRLLTGADLDIESVVRAQDGSLWIGDEFGPFLVHADRTGRVLEAPVAFPDGKSPSNPTLAAGEKPNVPSSGGFEALAASADGRYLYPVVERALLDDTQARRRWVYEYDTRKHRYTGQRWAYQTDMDGDMVADAHTVGRHRLVIAERDDFQGAKAVIKRVYTVDLDRTDAEGYATKTLLFDALDIANPGGIGAGDGYGTGDPFSLPVQSFETIVPLGHDRYLIANDNNYPGNDARVPGTPDDTEMDVVEIRPTRVATDDVTLIGHRGAPAYEPEHTLASYATAIRLCADYIEPDVVSTKDGVLVARHENEIGGTTDVASHPEFADRRTTKTIDGKAVTGWFTEDFTLAELKTLRAKERIPATRPANTALDGLYQVPTLDEVLDLARHSRTCDGKAVGVYPETKHPSYFASVGLPLEKPLLAELHRNGFDRPGSPVFIQSFEVGNLRALHRMTRLPLVQLVDCSGAPYDLRAAGDPRTYADLVTASGLRDVARYADGVGVCKDVMIPRTAAGTLGTPTTVIRDAHRAGLVVHGWTFRPENTFLPTDLRSSADPNAYGDMTAEVDAFLAAGMDGFFTDAADRGTAAIRAAARS